MKYTDDQNTAKRIANAVAQMDYSAIRKEALNGRLISLSNEISYNIDTIKKLRTSSFDRNSASILFHNKDFQPLCRLHYDYRGKSGHIHYFLSIAYMFFMDFNRVTFHIEYALSLQPNNPEFIRTRAFLFLFFGRTHDAQALVASAPDIAKPDLNDALGLVSTIPKSFLNELPWDCDNNTISRRWISSALDQNDLLRPYILLLYFFKKLRSPGADDDLAPLYAYCLLRQNRRKELNHELRIAEYDLTDIRWRSILLFSDRWRKQFDSIIEYCETIIPQPVKGIKIFYSLAFECFCEALLSLGRADQLSRVIESDIEMNGHKPWNLLYSGILAFRAGNGEYKRLWEDAGLSNTFCLNHSWGVNSYRGKGVIKFGDSNFVFERSDTAKNKRRVMLHACDINYFQMFIDQKYKDSLYDRDGLWHVHLVFDTESKVSLKTLERQFPGMSFSAEFHLKKMPKAYYTVARFLIAERIIEIFNLPTIIMDIDAVLRDSGRLSDLLSNKSDIGLKYVRHNFHFPWHRISASGVLLFDKEQSLMFLQTYRHWLERNFEESHNFQWWIDQVALHESEASMRKYIRFGDFFQEINDAFVFAKPSLEAKREMAGLQR